MSIRAIIGVMALLAVLGCSGQRPATQAASTDSSAAPAAAPSPAVVTYIARDYGFEGPGQIQAGATLFRLDNQGKELHHMVLVRLDQGRTYDSLLAALRTPGPPPAWMHLVGGPNATGPGSNSNATHNLVAGHYAILCLIPSADGVPHMAKGMTAPLEVVVSSGPAARIVPADVTITLNDYSFTLSTPLTAGNHVIQVDNAGPQPHELVLARLAPGKTVKDIERWEKGGEKGEPPVSPVGGIAPMMAKESGQFTVQLTPGEYVLICFVPDAKDGKGHLMHGMVKSFTVG
ncbi:MAG TPA: hypothetical protein VIG08_12020 [Gemmatimonadales bacterium]|jgi:hypothetical protein